jgi:feruloyl esterase
MKSDATPAAAIMSAAMLPNIATITPAVTPPGRFMRIIYDGISAPRHADIELVNSFVGRSIAAVSRSRLVICLLTPIALCACARVKAEASPCDSVQKVQLPNTTITNARIVNTGAFQMPRRGARASVEFFNSFNTLRAFCRVEATVTPSADSHINVEVWLPVTEWNGRFLGVGNGGFGGSIAYYRLGEAVNSGYAAGSTDTGHHGSSRDSR